MLDKILDILRENGNDKIVNNPSIGNEKNESALHQGASSIFSTLQAALLGGRFKDLLGFFKNGGSQDHPIVKEATRTYANDLQTKIGLGQQEASDIASEVIPSTMTQLANKTNDPSDKGFNIQDIFNQLSGGKTGSLDIQGMLNKFGGGKLDKDGDGDVDFQDLASMFAGGQGGGLADNLKGLFN